MQQPNPDSASDSRNSDPKQHHSWHRETGSYAIDKFDAWK
jgi:hypothetical protein